MYRVLAIVLMAFVICYPRMGSQSAADLASYTSSPTRAERIFADVSAWLERPIDRIMAAIGTRIRKHQG